MQSAENLLARLRDRGLISATAGVRCLDDGKNSAATIEALVLDGSLTRFQADLIRAERIDEVKIGRYVLLELLGIGGMGHVYLARDPAMDRKVAIKVVRDRGNWTDAVRRFHKELVAAGRSAHPNVVAAYDTGETDSGPYLVMEYIAGDNLATLIREQDKMSVVEAADAVRQAALGLHHIHESGHFHCDIKPSNLLRTSNGKVIKVADLGLARVVGELDEGEPPFGSIVGTPDYLAPEAAENPRSVDARSDVYSLGCTFYHILSGRPPFTGGSAQEKIQWHLDALPAPIENLRPNLPAGLAAVVHKMMARRPGERHQTAAEIAVALEPYVKGTSAAPPSVEAMIGMLRGESRPKKWAARLGPLLLILIGIVAWFVWPIAWPEAPGIGTRQTVEGLSASGSATMQRVSPDRAQASRDRTDRGKQALNAGDLVRAFADLDEAVRLDPTNALALGWRGVCFQKRGDLDRAISDFTQAARLTDHPAKHIANRAEAHRTAGRPERAEADFTEAIRLEPGIAYYRVERGRIRLGLGNNQFALEDFDEAIRLDPNRRFVYRLRAGARDKLGDSEGAARMLTAGPIPIPSL